MIIDKRLVVAMFFCMTWLIATGSLITGSHAASIQTAHSEAGSTTDLTDEEYQRTLMNRYEKMVSYNLDNNNTLPSSLLDSMMSEFRSLKLGERISAWAEYFYTRGDVTYRFGLKKDGYVTQGRLVNDYATDCILFFYRVTELGRSSSALEAVQFAFGTRFHGASLEKIVSLDGQVDYDDPVHLDFSIDIIHSGIWGASITKEVGRASADQAGSTRYDGGVLSFVPEDKINYRKFRSGDIVYFVSDENTEAGKRLREFGAIIAHVGIVKVEGNQVFLIHPASTPIEGIYQGGKLEKILLKTYLERVENFKGIMATRIENF